MYNWDMDDFVTENREIKPYNIIRLFKELNKEIEELKYKVDSLEKEVYDNE